MTQPTPREMTRPDFPAVVHTYTDLLRLLRDEGPLSVAALAERTKRDPSNLRRDLPKLTAADVITVSGDKEGKSAALTDKGRQWVIGRDVADGLIAAPTGEAAPARWPIDKFRPNPANRKVDPDGIPGMADAIEAFGDIRQPIEASPPDAAGVRIIFDGERRWRGASLLAERGDVSGMAIAEGLPFIERRATAAEQLRIIIVTATEREGLTPWQDAQLLLQYQRQTGGSASDVARDLGRAGEGRSGLRDVQTKLKVAREATDEAIAEYERNGSWDQLRNSVSTPRPQDRLPPHQELAQSMAASGPAVMSAPSNAAPADGDPLSPGAELALIEIAWIVHNQPFIAHGGPAAAKTNGYGYMSDSLRSLRKRGMIEEQAPTVWGRICCLVWLLESGRDWIGARYPDGVSDEDLATARERIGRQDQVPGAGEDTGFLTYPLNAKISAENLEFARRVHEEPSDTELLRLFEIGHKLATNPDRAKGADRALATDDAHRDKSVSSLSWASILRVEHDRGKDWVRWTDAADRLVRNAGFDAIDATALDAIRERAGLDAEAIEALRVSGGYATTWLNPEGARTAAKAEDDPLVVNGVRYPNLTRAKEARFAAGLDKRKANTGGGHKPTPTTDEREAPPSAATPQEHPTNAALRLIADERRRQVEAEGYDPAHDDVQNSEQELAYAAAAYALSYVSDGDASDFWPATWDPAGFKPTETDRDLIRAGALIVAELERRARRAGGV